MNIIHKNNQDFVFLLNIVTYNSQLSRVHDFKEFKVKIYTNDINEYVEASYRAYGEGLYNNIIEQNNMDFIIINSNDLNTLDDGVMKLHIDYTISSGYYVDGTYDGSYDIETNYILRSKIYDQSKCRLIED
jgi:hypothetical protein